MEEIDIVQRYRESHHRVAQMLAAGCTDSFITQTTGRSQRSITILRADPTFRDLVSKYGEATEAKWAQATDVFADIAIGNMLRTESMIADRLDEAQETGEHLPLLTLDRIAQGRADRFGYGKHQTVKHEHDFAALLDRAIDRSGKRAEVTVIDVEAVPVPPPRASSPPLRLEAPAEQASDPVTREPPPTPARRSFASVLSGGIKRRKVA
jgi:hypothetical protein